MFVSLNFIIEFNNFIDFVLLSFFILGILSLDVF